MAHQRNTYVRVCGMGGVEDPSEFRLSDISRSSLCVDLLGGDIGKAMHTLDASIAANAHTADIVNKMRANIAAEMPAELSRQSLTMTCTLQDGNDRETVVALCR